mmetsp:Transcript_997/g.3019  ORF Transcript_997/g.3019 Transcript_997/m.3019 type:complete len:273 (-) Transcript_997:1550-2368(-)
MSSATCSHRLRGERLTHGSTMGPPCAQTPPLPKPASTWEQHCARRASWPTPSRSTSLPCTATPQPRRGSCSERCAENSTTLRGPATPLPLRCRSSPSTGPRSTGWRTPSSLPAPGATGSSFLHASPTTSRTSRAGTSATGQTSGSKEGSLRSAPSCSLCRPTQRLGSRGCALARTSSRPKVSCAAGGPGPPRSPGRAVARPSRGATLTCASASSRPTLEVTPSATPCSHLFTGCATQPRWPCTALRRTRPRPPTRALRCAARSPRPPPPSWT